jgi:type II secretory pathway predicted ATPase ExeA
LSLCITSSFDLLRKLAPDDILAFVRAELDRAGLPHTVFTDDALALVARASEGVLRRVRNLCLGALLEAVRDRIKTVDLPQVNRVLLQPHWRERPDPA